MTEETASDHVAAKVREQRKALRWQLSDLAARCQELGDDHLTEHVIENIEGGRRKDGKRRRDVTVDELLVLARALQVSPASLFPGLDTPEAGVLGPLDLEQMDHVATALQAFVSLQKWRAKSEGGTDG